MNRGTITIKMTKSAKDFWNDPVWDQWKQHYHDLKVLIDNYPKHIIKIEEVPVVRYTSAWMQCKTVFIMICSVFVTHNQNFRL